MSTSRIDKRAGWTSGTLRPCRECGTMPKPPRRTFCSAACVTAWKVRTQPAFAAGQVLARDRGVCVDCGLDCVALRAELHVLLKRSQGWRTESPWGSLSEDERAQAIIARDARLADVGLAHVAKKDRALGSRRLWEMDHITPVVEGGGSCGLDNLRTLCWRCHARATAQLAKRRAELRRAHKAVAQ